MIKLGNRIKLTKGNEEFVKKLTGRNSLPGTIDGYDFALEQSALAVDDGSPEGRFLAGMIRVSKSIPDELEPIPDPDEDEDNSDDA